MTEIESLFMSLDVSPTLLSQAEHGSVDDQAFVACVRDSLPYAWETVSGLVAELERTPTEYAGRAGAWTIAQSAGQ